MTPTARQITDRTYRTIGIVAIVAVSLFLIFKFVSTKIVEKRTTEENNLIFEKLRATAKLVVWEQNFRLTNITKAEKKYFDSELFKFTEKVVTTAKGKIGFHIDLGDSIHTQFVLTQKSLEIHAPLQITYVSIDNGSIEQIKEASYDPTLEVSKEEIVRRLNEIALRENLQPALEKAKRSTMAKQEKTLAAIAGRPVKIVITEMPTLQNGLDWIKRN